MSLVVMGLIAAAVAGVGGLVAARTIRKRRALAPKPPAMLPAADEPEEREEDPFAGLALRLGHVLQHGEATRWPRTGLLIRCANEIRGAILLSREAGRDQATVVLAPPERDVLWLEARDVALPSTPPTRLEIDGYLLDRKLSFPAALEPVGEDRGQARFEDEAVFAIYEGGVGDAAVVLAGREGRAWYGPRLGPEDYDDLGLVDEDTADEDAT